MTRRHDDGARSVLDARLPQLAAQVGEVLGHLGGPGHGREVDRPVGSHARAEEEGVAVVHAAGTVRGEALAVRIAGLLPEEFLSP